MILLRTSQTSFISNMPDRFKFEIVELVDIRIHCNIIIEKSSVKHITVLSGNILIFFQTVVVLVHVMDAMIGLRVLSAVNSCFTLVHASASEKL